MKKYNTLTLLAVELCWVMPGLSREYFKHTFPPLLQDLYCCPFWDADKLKIIRGSPTISLSTKLKQGRESLLISTEQPFNNCTHSTVQYLPTQYRRITRKD